MYLGQGTLLGDIEKSQTILVRVAGSPTLDHPLHATTNTEWVAVDLRDP